MSPAADPDSTARSSRRRFLAAASLAGTTALAGCADVGIDLGSHDDTDPQGERRLLDARFFDGIPDAWTVTRSDASRTVARTVAGRLDLGVIRCNRVLADRPLDTEAGDLTVSFAWETTANGWYEIPGVELLDDAGDPVAYDVVEGTDISNPGQNGQKTGSATLAASVDGPVTLRFAVTPSRYCEALDHGWTHLHVDDVVATLDPA